MKEINIANFTGPLDLLLHLAKTSEIEITDISLDELIEQYLNYIQSIKELGIDVASSFLEMAAELIRLKSIYLLPEIKEDELEDAMNEIGIDRETLINKLLEYKKYKEVIPEFEVLIAKRQHFFDREPEKLMNLRKNNFENNLTVEAVEKSMTRYLLSIKNDFKETKVIEHNELNIEKYMDGLKTLESSFNFSDFVKDNSKHNIVSMFLAILESLKLQVITVEVKDNDFVVLQFKEIND